MKKKYIFYSIIALILLVIGLNRFYYYMQLDHWTERHAAVETALKEAGITEVDQANPYIWDDSYYVVSGKNKAGVEVMTWIPEDGKEVETREMSDGVSKERIAALTKERSPDAEILRILPGKMKGAPIWEVFYTKVDGSEERHFYDFYQWKDGRYIVTYNMSIH
ncbi:hypothetical protein SY83_18370 [Paenibacillus swuensis]|uniref:Cell wall elongation regulator TseB-like domain-containing protein n=1 Tax=Paenibacillus swuensis TaxID=1178515 RepID=A0A172TLS4_9BACL|nr:DUF5590 domain-containing protein [Paenibacillus swuensis]ANE47932.1 hypothetical protein SY83_18370 [Paenibacillus swuensis]